MSYRVVRILVCDCHGCETPSPYCLQGEDDQALKDGWTEYAKMGRKLHACPECSKQGKVPESPASQTVEC